MQFHQQKLAGFLARCRITIPVLACTFLLLITYMFTNNCPGNSLVNQKIVCVDSDYDSNTTGLENVRKPRDITVPHESSCINFALVESPMIFNSKERRSIKECIKTSDYHFNRGHRQFWTGSVQEVRVRHHSYLDHASRIMDIGGNVGEDADNFIKMYDVQTYIILEPMKYLYRKLQLKFKDNKKVSIYNIGLAKTNAKYYVDMKGREGDGTSIFHQSDTIGSCTLKTVNASEFYLKIGLGCFEIDLVTINCEGCEFDVLENMLLTGVAKYFRHIQFASHIHLAHIKDAVQRYCRIQELLSRTHTLKLGLHLSIFVEITPTLQLDINL